VPTHISTRPSAAGNPERFPFLTAQLDLHITFAGLCLIRTLPDLQLRVRLHLFFAQTELHADGAVHRIVVQQHHGFAADVQMVAA